MGAVTRQWDVAIVDSGDRSIRQDMVCHLRIALHPGCRRHFAAVVADVAFVYKRTFRPRTE